MTKIIHLKLAIPNAFLLRGPLDGREAAKFFFLKECP